MPVDPTRFGSEDPGPFFHGNVTRSYRTRDPLRVLGEVVGWQGHPPEVLQGMLDHLAELTRQGVEAIND